MTRFSGGSRHHFTSADREAQLTELGLHCDGLAELFAQHDDDLSAALFGERADRARALLADGYRQGDLEHLGRSLPAGPVWLNPRYVDANGPREPWQDEIARRHALAASVALDLRAVATIDRG